MGTRTAVRLAWALWALAVTLAALQLLVMSTSGLPQESERLGSVGGVLMRLLYVLTVVLLATIGALIASRHAQRDWLAVLRLGLPVRRGNVHLRVRHVDAARRARRARARRSLVRLGGRDAQHPHRVDRPGPVAVPGWPPPGPPLAAGAVAGRRECPGF